LKNSQPAQLHKKRYAINNKGKMLNQTEAEVSRDVKRALKTFGCFFRRIECTAKLVHSGKGVAYAPSEQKGFPDVLAIYQGKVFGMELKKTVGGQLSHPQAETLAEMIKNGGVAGVVCSAEGAINMLQGMIPTQFLTTHVGEIPVWL
jgi:hypothetical protein